MFRRSEMKTKLWGKQLENEASTKKFLPKKYSQVYANRAFSTSACWG